jgi:hypothetical protein
MKIAVIVLLIVSLWLGMAYQAAVWVQQEDRCRFRHATFTSVDAMFCIILAPLVCGSQGLWRIVHEHTENCKRPPEEVKK